MFQVPRFYIRLRTDYPLIIEKNYSAVLCEKTVWIFRKSYKNNENIKWLFLKLAQFDGLQMTINLLAQGVSVQSNICGEFSDYELEWNLAHET